eukprot:comp18255_c0_seq1/m.19242 comp18255_c0_seq1/g.19242  ORF comp18255_c0_seq1/g.19242 comp18255_c0_seq1/m.19242 type:complete len:301 (-) comp18255_c0_seq1:663-1565(-)
MKTICFAAALVAATTAMPFEKPTFLYEHLDFDAWADHHGKFYETGLDRQLRENIFNNNVKRIAEFNARNGGNNSYWLDINHLADMTHEEYKRTLLGTWLPSGPRQSLGTHDTSNGTVSLSVDWRMKNLVTPVKNQGQCGSCYAFSTTGSLEGQYAKATGKLVSFSEQQLVDCSAKEGNQGCQGGLMDDAFLYLEKHGIEREDDYSYDGQKESCRFKAAEVVTKVKGFLDIESGDEDALTHAIGTVGPISVAIDASHFSFQFYRGGVYDEVRCSSTQLDHGVLAVGYGTDNGKDYYWVKNR